MHDVVVVGAGFGGLHCAARLAKAGMKVLLAEKSLHCGGTSSIFRRGGYGFPMGPLSFSHPALVRRYLEELVGDRGAIAFRRNHFQLLSPRLDIVYSQPLDDLAGELKGRFPGERGIDAFFAWLRRVAGLLGDGVEGIPAGLRDLAGAPASALLERSFSSPVLRNLMGSMGTTPPTMSVLNLALMWKAMSETGIWYPSCGLQGLHVMLADAYSAAGGVTRLGEAVEEILVRGGKAAGVRLASGEEVPSRWVVSNADYKTTFLELLDARALPAPFLKRVRVTPYTTSEICVYLGVDGRKVDFSRMRATHLFYSDREAGFSGPEDFDCREIEICRWSDNEAGLIPPGKVSLVLRVDFPYALFAPYRLGERKRREGYGEYKRRLAGKLVRTAARVLPGLESAVEVVEASTPLTYRDWGHRHMGSIAGWNWGVKGGGTGGGLLVETPVRNLLMAGIYASSELYLGGVPTAFHTGAVAADLVRKGRSPVRCPGGLDTAGR